MAEMKEKNFYLCRIEPCYAWQQFIGFLLECFARLTSNVSTEQIRKFMTLHNTKTLLLTLMNGPSSEFFR
jgi:hypothetical protein